MAEDFISGALAGQQFQLNQFLIQEAPVKLEQEKMALTIKKQEFDKTQKMAELLAAKPPPQGQNPLENAAIALTAIGGAEMSVGNVEEAASSYAKAAQLTTQQEDAAYKNWEQTLQKTKFADSILGNVTSQQGWDQANMYIKMVTGQDSALAHLKYSPELVKTLQAASEKKRSEAQEAYDRARANKENSDVQLNKERGNLLKAQEDWYERRAAAAGKVGTDGVIAKPTNVRAVTDKLLTDNPNMDPAQARTLAREIALDAEERMAKEGKTQEEAVTAAVKNSKEHGVLAGITPAKVRPGMSMKNGLPLPANPSDPTQYKDEMWYKTDQGPMWYDAETQALYKPGEKARKDDEGDEE